MVSDYKKNAELAVRVGCFIYYFLCKGLFANLNAHFCLDFEQQNKSLQETEYFSLLLPYLRAKYESIWLDFTVKTLNFSKLKIVYCSSNK